MTMWRRTRFATSLVAIVTACGSPPPVQEPGDDEDELDDDDELGAGTASPPPMIPRVEPTRPLLPERHPELLDALPPLESQVDYRAKCDAGVYQACLPGPPKPGDLPLRVEPATTRITWIMRDGTGSRLRFISTDARTDVRWTAELVAPGTGKPLGPCRVVAAGGYEIECTSPRAPEAIVGNAVRVIPPPALVAAVSAELCRDPRSGWRCNPPPPLPATWSTQRVLKLQATVGRLVLTLGVGSAAGITTRSACRWPGHPTVACTITHVATSTCEVMLAVPTVGTAIGHLEVRP